MKKVNRKALVNSIIRILSIAIPAFLLDNLVVWLSEDNSIWLGESIEVVGSVIFGPVIGGVATLLNCLVTDFLAYGSFNYIFVSILEAVSVALIGAVYRRLNKDEDRFGVREIVIFNFVQVLINVCVLFLSTGPMAITIFGFLTEDWTRSDMLVEMVDLRDNTFSACISVALIGTVLMAACTFFRKKYRENGSISGVFRAIRKPTYTKKEYRTRAFEYSIGFVFAVTLTMVDGVVSGHVLGSDALAATSILFPLTSLSAFLSNIVTSGCSNLCAMARGERNYDRANRMFTLGFMVTLSLGLLQSFVFWLIKDLYLDFYTSTEVIGNFAGEYYNVFIFVPPFMALTTFMDEMVASEGDDILCYAGYLGSFVINVVMSIVLAKSIGMEGLALGTLLSYVFYLIVVSAHFTKKSNTIKVRFWFSFRDIARFIEYSLKANTAGLCLALASGAFTKAILQFMGSDYLVANTVLCAMMEIYEMINGPSEAAEYMLAIYTGEKNKEGIKTLFSEALVACLLCGVVVALVFMIVPGALLSIYGVENSPYEAELIKCIRFSSAGVIAAAVGGFLSDYYGNLGKPLWSCLMVVFRIALFPILLCVTLGLEGGIVSMGKGLMLSQILAVAVFYGFVLILKGVDMIPYMLDDPDFEKVYTNPFDYTPKEYERICCWIRDILKLHGVDEDKIEEAEKLFMTLCKKTGEKNGEKTVLGECVLRFIDKPEIIIKDNGELFDPEIKDERMHYDVLLACNSSTIRLDGTLKDKDPEVPGT